MNPAIITTVVTAITLAIMGGLVIFITVKLSFKLLKQLRTRKNTKLAVVRMKDYLKTLAKDPNTTKIKFEDLDKLENSDCCVAEVDSEYELVGKIKVYDEADEALNCELKKAHEGVILLED